jgi:hypothetical protein
MPLGNQFQPFAAAKVPCTEVLVVALAHEVRANFLLKSRRHRDQGCHPMGLGGLCLRYADLIATDERVAILLAKADGRQNDECKGK